MITRSAKSLARRIVLRRALTSITDRQGRPPMKVRASNRMPPVAPQHVVPTHAVARLLGWSTARVRRLDDLLRPIRLANGERAYGVERVLFLARTMDTAPHRLPTLIDISIQTTKRTVDSPRAIDSVLRKIDTAFADFSNAESRIDDVVRLTITPAEASALREHYCGPGTRRRRPTKRKTPRQHTREIAESLSKLVSRRAPKAR